MIDNTLFNAITDGLLALSGWEVFASLLGIGYVIFAAKESQWCWPLAFVSTLIYTLLFWQDQLPMQALLNFYYMAMAIYGYLLWQKQGQAEDVIAISKLTWPRQFAFLITGSLLTFLTAKYLISIDASQSPYLDAGVTVFSVLNTVLMARKVLQNWLYWIVIDAAAIQLYYETGYYATIVMFSVYLVLALVGYLNWMKLYYKEPSLPH
jgi:nicotinamide mononucleotide transporter